MKQHPFHRIALSIVAASALALGLSSCAVSGETTTPSSSEKSDSPVDASSQASGSVCNWDETRLIVADFTPPTGQQGDLAEILVGEWQYTHYDLGLGGGWESWEDDNDRRYVYADATELVYCVIAKSGDSPSELGATYTVVGDQITLDNGNGSTAVAWTKDVLLLSNHYDDSLELFHRR